jgi:hypothetical protein
MDRLHFVLIGFGALLGGQIALLYRIAESLHSIRMQLKVLSGHITRDDPFAVIPD